MAESKSTASKPNSAARKTNEKGFEKNGSKKDVDTKGVPVTSFQKLNDYVEAIPGIKPPEA